MKHIGIVVSAGKGLRVGGDVPKQYMDLCGRPVITYCLQTLQESFIDEIVIVVGAGDVEYVKKEIVGKFSFTKVKAVVEGGAERSDSVFNGLKAVSTQDSYVYIQDAARPMLSLKILEAAKEDVEAFGSSVIAVRAKDTVKVVDAGGFVVTTPDRRFLWNVQTPQAFSFSDIYNAYLRYFEKGSNAVTDDASVMEQFGNLPVHITEGSYENIKITTPEDFVTAERFLKGNCP
ncbi:MAG: 2-C-methyl-D-erythritol 4-phosphate cytidylyltransferase [Lachnospiraceae bacterium]|nr:2-C-methyl-D-erythritol 4-phosphate cytidylyltransferase [Lachnospiraceae bacterium]